MIANIACLAVIAGILIYGLYTSYVIIGIGKTSIWCPNCNKWRTKYHNMECYKGPAIPIGEFKE